MNYFELWLALLPILIMLIGINSELRKMNKDK